MVTTKSFQFAMKIPGNDLEHSSKHHFFCLIDVAFWDAVALAPPPILDHLRDDAKQRLHVSSDVRDAQQRSLSNEWGYLFTLLHEVGNRAPHGWLVQPRGPQAPCDHSVRSARSWALRALLALVAD